MKAMINRSNYEIFFIDFFDGKLDQIRKKELMEFLDANPDLKEEFQQYAPVKTEPDLTISFKEKNRLKKGAVEFTNYKTQFVAYLENDLDESGKKEVEKFLSENKSLASEFALFKQVKSVPDENIIYMGKSNLKKGGRMLAFNPRLNRVAVAAAMALLILFSYVLIFKPASKRSDVAEKPSIENNNEQNSGKGPVINESVVKEKNMASADPATVKRKSEAAPLKTIDPVKSKPENSTMALLNRNEKINSPLTVFTEIKKDTSSHSIPSTVEMDGSENLVASATGTENSIFSDEDLKEFEANTFSKKNSGINTSLISLAGRKIKNITRASEISLDKLKNDESNSETYALEIGESFSVSYTRTK